MNQKDNMSSPVEMNLGPAEPLLGFASNSAPSDSGPPEERTLETAVDGVEDLRFREPVVQNILKQAIMIEGYLVPSSLAATAISPPYRLASSSRYVVGMLLDFSGAAVVAAVVALFATGELQTPWNIGASGKTEGRPADTATHAAPAPTELEPFSPALPQSGVALSGRESQLAGVAAPALAPVAVAPAADPALSRSSPSVSVATNSDKALKEQRIATAVLPAEPSARAPSPPDQVILARELKGELRRVGCDPGNINGDWNAISRRALENFNKYARTKLDAGVANLNALRVIRSRMSRVCPLTCDRDSHVRGDRCVVETPSGRRNADRNHLKRTAAGRPTLTATRVPVVSSPSSRPASEPAGTDYWRANANF
jgi:hypothetical protein